MLKRVYVDSHFLAMTERFRLIDSQALICCLAGESSAMIRRGGSRDWSEGPQSGLAASRGRKPTMFSAHQPHNRGGWAAVLDSQIAEVEGVFSDGLQVRVGPFPLFS